jgi:hypothetical protein
MMMIMMMVINIGEEVITAFRCLQGSTISVAGKE